MCTGKTNLKLIKLHIYCVLVCLLALALHPVCNAAIPDKILEQQKSVVMIQVKENGKTVSFGTGFFIDPNGIIVTNYHVVSKWFEGSNKVAVARTDSGAFVVLEGLIAIDKTNDIALVKCKTNGFPAVNINRQARAKKGENAYVIGSPLGLDASLSEGIVSNIRKETQLIQITAPISRGSSGSPVYNSLGEVIGMATSQAKTGQNINFAVPISKILRLFDENRQGGLLARPVSPAGTEMPARKVETPADNLQPVPEVPKKAQAPCDEKPLLLNFSGFFRDPHRNSVLARQYCKEIEKRSGGRVKITYFAGGMLVPGERNYSLVASGAIEIGESCFACVPGKFPMMGLLDLPLGYKNGIQATRLANAYYKRFQPKELGDVKVLFLHAHGPGLIHTTFPVHKLEDLRGKKIRATAMAAKVVQALGAQPVGIRAPETREAIRTGVADGVMAPFESLLGWKWGDVVNFTIFGFDSSYTTAMFVFMNKKKWESLPPDIRQIIDEVSEEWAAKQGQAWDQLDKTGLVYFKGKNGTIVLPGKDEGMRWANAVKPLIDEYVRTLRSRGLPGREAADFCLDYLRSSH